MTSRALVVEGDPKLPRVTACIFSLGMDEWIQLEESRLKKLNGEGISMIKKQLEYAYVDKNTKGLEGFLDHKNNAIKKANIAKPEEKAYTWLVINWSIKKLIGSI